MNGRKGEALTICETCPWLLKNHGRPNPTGGRWSDPSVKVQWYSNANLKRLWNGIRTLKAPGMICHSSDPANGEYGGKGNVRPDLQPQECGGAMLMVLMCVNAICADKPQPFTPGITKAKVADIAWRKLTGTLPSVPDRSTEVGLPLPRG